MPAPEVQYAFGLMVDGSLGSDNGCSGSGIVEGSEQYGSWYALNVDGDTDELVEGNWAGSPDIPTWYQHIEQYASHGVPAAIAAAALQHKSASHANVTTSRRPGRRSAAATRYCFAAISPTKARGMTRE